jgi:hypothetical protein
VDGAHEGEGQGERELQQGKWLQRRIERRWRGRGRGRGRSRGGDRGANGDGAGRDACYNCGKTSHWARECWAKQKQEEAHVAQDEESSLLLLEAVGEEGIEILSLPSEAVPLQAGSAGGALAPSVEDGLDLTNTDKGSPSSEGDVHLVEDRVFTQFNEQEKTECHQWVLDTDATNHMTRCRAAFSDLDRNIQGTVRFGDGSIVKIEGMGTILFCCKNGEHRAFVGVYFIPKLTTNIISIGHLDEAGFQTIVDGGIRIRDVDHRFLAKVNRSPNQLYVLDVEITEPVCLLARGSEEAWLWHTRFGHLNFQALRKLARDDMVRRLPRWNR